MSPVAQLKHGPAPAAAAVPTWVVPLSDVEVDDEIEEALLEAFRSGWWSMGPRVLEFEEEFGRFTGAGHAIAVSNGTAALHLALLAVGCGPGDEVVVPSLNFVAAANAIRHTGATPVFVDIEAADDLNMSLADLEAAITDATRAVVVLHYGGHPGRIDGILEIARRHRLAVVEDAAHAPGATWQGRSCGTLGDVGCFSFFSNKNLPMGEGGMIVTDDDELARKIRLLRSHGMTTLTWDRHRGHAHTYDVVEQGFNYRMDELRAAIGVVQLRRLADRNAQRERLVGLYREAFRGCEGLTMPFAPEENVRSAHHLAVVVLAPDHSRDDVRTALAARGIQTSVHYPPIHRFSLYRESGSRRPLPITDTVAGRLLTLPLYPTMTEREVAAVTDALLESL